MIDFSRRRAMGASIAEYIETLPYELDGDGVGFWVIVPAGRSFDLVGDDLAEFIRICIVRLINVGGVPVRHSDSGKLKWHELKSYGTSAKDIAAGIVSEWLASGAGNPAWDSLWFVTRKVLQTSEIWQEPGQD